MNIVCEKCATVYRIDPSRIPKHGKKVKCSKCGHVFVARAPRDEDEVPTAEHEADFAAELPEDVNDLEAEPTDPGRGKKAEAPSKRLLLRQDGTRYAVSDLATLQRWIVERRVSRDAELSEDGEVWERVGERMDLLPFFGIVERSRRRRAARKAKAARPAGSEQPAVGERPDEPTVVQRRPEAVAAAAAAEALAESAIDKAAGSQAEVTQAHQPGGDAVEKPASSDAVEEAAGAGKAETQTSVSPAGEDRSEGPLKTLAAVVIVVLLIVVAFVVKVRYIDQRQTTAPGRTGTPPATIRQPVASARTPKPPHPVTKTPHPRQAVAATPTHAQPAGVQAVPGASPAPTGPHPSTEPGSEKTEAPKPAPSPAPARPTPRPTAPTPKKAKSTATTTQSSTSVASKPKSTQPATSTSASRWIAIGQSRLRAHRFEDAVEAFRNAVAKSPDSARTHKELGLGLLNLADVQYGRRNALLEEAAQEFQTAIRLKSGYAEAYHLLGVTYMQLDKKAEAAKNLRLALENGLSGDDATEARVFLQNLVDELAGENATP